jgi:hypothetical protein
LSGNVLVTKLPENTIQTANSIREECRAQVLIASSHAQILRAQQLRYRVDVCALHPQPTCCCVSQIVETKINDFDGLTARQNAVLT